MENAKEEDSEVLMVPLVPEVPKTKGARTVVTLFHHVRGCSLERDEVPEALAKQGIPLHIWVATFDALRDQHFAGLQVAQRGTGFQAGIQETVCWVFCVTLVLCGMLFWPFRNLKLQGAFELLVAIVFFPLWFLGVPLVFAAASYRKACRQAGVIVQAMQEVQRSWTEFVEQQEQVYGPWGVKVGQVVSAMLPSGTRLSPALTATAGSTRYLVGALEFRVVETGAQLSARVDSNNDNGRRLLVQDLQALFDLFQAGGLTEAEYSQAKVQFLRSSNTPQEMGNESFIV